ncbi:MAG TPA: hypothetical protein VLJ58_06750 [Ramlibacter sp.]|nr:hypothetical protein [Ramlibacter sp.]
MRQLAPRALRTRHPVLHLVRSMACWVARRCLPAVARIRSHSNDIDLAQRVRESGEW